MASLFDKVQLGNKELRNRIFMAPLTRGRASVDGVPTPIMETYYEQRASAGLIISEATAISPMGVGWYRAPGIFNQEQVLAWRQINTKVHQAGGTIFAQLWHMGRLSHPDFLEGRQPLAPSAILAKGESRTPLGKKPFVLPRAMTEKDFEITKKAYISAARRAIEAGFDGVEIHGANGYLLDTFVRSSSNQRCDRFGGSIDNRWRYPLQVVDAVTAEIGPGKVGYRISPTNPLKSMSDNDPLACFTYGARRLRERGLAYLHVMEPKADHPFGNKNAPWCTPQIIEAFQGGLVIANGGYDKETAGRFLENNPNAAIAFGVPFIANPDLVARFKQKDPVYNKPDPETFYTHAAEGYIDYDFLNKA